MWYNCNYLNGMVELTDERREHIASRHPDVIPFLSEITATLDTPDEIHSSQRDPETLVFYRVLTSATGKSLALVVKVDRRAFILSAYLTRTRVNGDIVWAKN
jgi:hypothetical protein